MATKQELIREFAEIEQIIAELKNVRKQYKIENGSHYEYEEHYFTLSDKICMLEERLWELDVLIDNL